MVANFGRAVLAMDQAMHLPYKVATTTSNFIIGITAAVLEFYLSYGYIEQNITFPVMVGVVLGSFSGAKILAKIHQHKLRLIYCIVMLFLALEKSYKACTGQL